MIGRLDPSFEDFARRRSSALLGTAFLLVGDHGHAEDLLQSALMRTSRRWATASEAPDSYVRRVLVNLATDRWRKLARRPVETVLQDELDTMALVEPDVRLLERTVLVAALAELPYRQRAVVVLRYFEDLSVANTADLLGCSEGTVKSSSNRALVRLRELLSTESDPSPKEARHER